MGGGEGSGLVEISVYFLHTGVPVRERGAVRLQAALVGERRSSVDWELHDGRIYREECRRRD